MDIALLCCIGVVTPEVALHFSHWDAKCLSAQQSWKPQPLDVFKASCSKVPYRFRNVQHPCCNPSSKDIGRVEYSAGNAIRCGSTCTTAACLCTETDSSCSTSNISLSCRSATMQPLYSIDEYQNNGLQCWYVTLLRAVSAHLQSCQPHAAWQH